MKGQILSLVLFLGVFCSYGQVTRCGADSKIGSNRDLHEIVNRKIAEFNSSSNFRKSNEVLRIPVVVHVIHNNGRGVIGGAGNTNISDEQIYSQIEVINEDFRKKVNTPGFNTNPVGADMEIEFFLANTGPNGEPSTGINRVYSSARSFNPYRDLLALSSLSYWDSNKYLNIWVTTLSSTFLGYAEFPIGDYDGLETVDIDERIDGVFIDHRSFGRETGTAVGGGYTLGRTLTHEIGHWLGLIHTWGDERCGNDFCDDTPTAESANESSSCDAIYSYCRGVQSRNMIENYLDYSVDSCMSVFTQDQKARVWAILNISQRRKNMVANSELFKPIDEPILVKILGNPLENSQFYAHIFVDVPKTYQVQFIDNLGRIRYESTFENSGNRSLRIPQTDLGFGILNMVVRAGDTVITKRIVSK